MTDMAGSWKDKNTVAGTAGCAKKPTVVHKPKVRCGSHMASECANCVYDANGNDKGKSWCNGECTWRHGKCILK